MAHQTQRPLPLHQPVGAAADGALAAVLSRSAEALSARSWRAVTRRILCWAISADTRRNIAL